MKPTMLLTRGLATALALLPILAVTVEAAPPPEPELLRVEIRPLEAPARVEATIPIQGRLTDASGHPVADGDYSMTFRVRDGVGELCTVGPTVVPTEKGLFNAYLTGCSPDIFDGRYLSIGVQVGADAEMSPWLPLRPVPYAMSLRPGATISNEDTGHGLTVKSSTSLGPNSALYAENSNPISGIGIWTKAVGSDATVVIENLGTGPLLKGFGGDLGEDEFRIDNNGAIQSKTNSTIFVPGIMAQAYAGGSAPPTFTTYQSGAVKVHPGTTGVAQRVLFPVTLPGVLYGQPVKVEALTVYYMTSTSATYISNTILWRQKGTGPSDMWTLAADATHKPSTTYTNYTVTTSGQNVLDGVNGLVTVELTLYFDNVGDAVTIGGVALTLWHHSLPPD
jgi:hypothetical protein